MRGSFQRCLLLLLAAAEDGSFNSPANTPVLDTSSIKMVVMPDAEVAPDLDPVSMCQTIPNARGLADYTPQMQHADKELCEAEGCVYTINACLPDTKRDWQLKSLIYDWKAPMSTVEDGVCTCAAEDSCGALNPAELVLNFAEMCLEIAIPAFPGVVVRIAMSGGMEWTGLQTESGYKSIAIKIAGAVSVRIMPVSVHFSLTGTLQIESRRADSFIDLIKYSLSSFVQSKIRSEMSNINEQVYQMNQRLNQLDPSFELHTDELTTMARLLKEKDAELAAVPTKAAAMYKDWSAEGLTERLDAVGSTAHTIAPWALDQAELAHLLAIHETRDSAEIATLTAQKQALEKERDEFRLTDASWPVSMAERVAVLRESLGLNLKDAFAEYNDDLTEMLTWFERMGFHAHGDGSGEQLWRNDEVQQHVAARMIELQGRFQASGDRRSETEWYKLWQNSNTFWRTQWGTKKMPATGIGRLRLIATTLAWYRVLEITKVAQLLQVHITKTLFGGESTGEDCLKFAPSSEIELHPCADGTDQCYKQYMLHEDYAEDGLRIFAFGGQLKAIGHGRLMCALLEGQEPATGENSNGVDELAAHYWGLPDGTVTQIPYSVLTAMPAFFRQLYESQRLAMNALRVTATPEFQDAADETLFLPSIVENLGELAEVNQWYALMAAENPRYAHWSTRDMLPVEVFDDKHCRPSSAVSRALSKEELLDCVDNGLTGWLLDFHNHKQVAEQLEQSIALRLAELQTNGAPVAFNWMYEGKAELSIEWGADKGYSLCSSDDSELQVAASYASMQRVKVYDGTMHVVGQATVKSWAAELMGYRFTQAWATEARAFNGLAHQTTEQALKGITISDDDFVLPSEQAGITATRHFLLRQAPTGNTHRLEIDLGKPTGGNGSPAMVITMATQLAGPLVNAIKTLREPAPEEGDMSKFTTMVTDIFRSFKGLVMGVNPAVGAALLAELIAEIAKNPFYSSRFRLDLQIKTPDGKPPSFDAGLKLINRVKVNNDAGGWLGNLIPTGTFMFSSGLTLDLTGFMLMAACRDMPVKDMFGHLPPAVVKQIAEAAELDDIDPEVTERSTEVHGLEMAPGTVDRQASIGSAWSTVPQYQPDEVGEYLDTWSPDWEDDIPLERLDTIRTTLSKAALVEVGGEGPRSSRIIRRAK